MKNILTVEVSQDIYELVLRIAGRVGQQPESLAAQWVATAARRAEQEDPMEAFIGAFNTGVADWGDRHDKYLGQALLDTHSSGDTES